MLLSRRFLACPALQIVLQRGDGDRFCVREPAVASFLSLCSWSKLYVFAQVGQGVPIPARRQGGEHPHGCFCRHKCPFTPVV